MRAYQLLEWQQAPVLHEVPVPDPGPGKWNAPAASCDLRDLRKQCRLTRDAYSSSDASLSRTGDALLLSAPNEHSSRRAWGPGGEQSGGGEGPC